MVHSRFISRFFLVAGAVAVLASCKTEPRNTEELIDPWLRERTPVNFRLESQIGAAVISNDWRNDAVGSISVSIITGGLDLTKVKVEAVDFKYPDSEYCPTASITKGSTLDLSDGSASFTVTAYNGETRTYTVTYTQFTDPLEGSYSFVKIPGILDASNAPQCSFVIIGGWDDAVVMSTVMDKYWHWGTGYMPTDEDDNTLSFRLEGADAISGATYGTIVNTAGPDGKYANYMYGNSIDVNDKYRLIPEGKSRWGKNGDGYIYIFDWADDLYAAPLYKLSLLDPGTYTMDGKTAALPCQALHRSFPGPFDKIDWNWPDTRWYTDNVRHVIWLINKTSDSPIPNHDDLLQ